MPMGYMCRPAGVTYGSLQPIDGLATSRRAEANEPMMIVASCPSPVRAEVKMPASRACERIEADGHAHAGRRPGGRRAVRRPHKMQNSRIDPVRANWMNCDFSSVKNPADIMSRPRGVASIDLTPATLTVPIILSKPALTRSNPSCPRVPDADIEPLLPGCIKR